MPGENLTRVEAQARKAIVDVTSYEVDLDLTEGDRIFGSTTTVVFSATPGSSTFIDAITDSVHSVLLNGDVLDPSVVSDGVRIQLDNLKEHNVLVVDAEALYTNTGEGLHRFVDPVDGEVYLYSQFEVPDSRRVFAVFEQPDLKATFHFTVTAPAAWRVVSNSPTPDPVKSGDSKTWEFATTPIMSSYLTAIIAGPYDVVESSLKSRDGREIPLAIYSRKSLTEFVDASYIFDITRKGFEFYEEKFDYAYPFAKYDQLFVPEFNAGAMENVGAVTFTESYVFRSKVSDAIRERRVVTILHELAHMWFGDLVTMKWWNDLWLNESFAEWASAQASADVTEWTEAWTTFAMMEKSAAYRQDQLPSTHPVVATINDLEDVQVNFDHITYAKGGSVLKQLVAWVGLDAFYAGVAAYFKKHAYSNTELKDLLAELETTSGRELTEWSKVWLETAGVNTLRPEIETGKDGVITKFDILQTAVTDYPTIRPHRLAVGFYALQGGKLVRTERVELDVAGDRTSVADLVGKTKPDLVLLNDDDLAYAKIRLDDDSLAVAMEHLKDIDDALARALVWGAAWDAMRDGETRASDYVNLVLDNIASETESTTIRVTLTQLLTAARFYVTPGKRDAVITQVGDALWALAEGAEAGSDAQFQFVKFFAAVPSTPAHVAALKALREGTSSLSGLEIDADLDWELLEGLVLCGAAGQPEIDAALDADNTANGQQAAARARATIPTAAAKKAAFDSLVDKDDQSNVIVRSIGVGYTHTNDPSSLAEQVAPYFDSITTVWKSRSYKIAEYIVLGLYPTPLVSQELADATKAWLATNNDIPALRRLVVENLAGIERALVAQKKDA
ncbi:MAG TPA: aminopeptidase N [Galbitalea sp.]